MHTLYIKDQALINC